VHLPEGFRFSVNGLSFELIQVGLNGRLQHLLGRLGLFGRQSLDLFY
jgi:hypothetical protein